MAVRLVIDSASDIEYSRAMEKGWVFLPITVSFGDEQLKDGIDINASSFYDRLIESDVMPVTSQITPYVYQQTFDKIIESGDTPIVITLSSKLSGTYQSACVAAENASAKVYVIDSLNAALGESLIVEYADRLVRQGLSPEEIVEKVEEKKGKIHLLALLDTLEYLKKGGRISSAVAFAGALLSIKPVIAVEDGEVKLVGKARGSKNGNNLLAEMIRNCGQIDYDMPYTLAYSGNSDALLKKYLEDSKHLWAEDADKMPVIRIGATIGTHVGPGAIGVAFFVK